MPPLFLGFFFLIGLFFGSFANVVSLRLKSEKGGILTGKSECPSCGHHLSFFENLPLLPWLFLRGKCRWCRAPISWQYPVAEIFFGFLFLLVAFQTPLSEGPLLAFRLLLVFAFGLLFLSDARYQDLPDIISVPTIAFVLFVSVFAPFLNIPFLPLRASLVGGVALYSFFAVLVLLPSGLAALRMRIWRPLFHGIQFVFLLPVWILFSFVGAHKWLENKVYGKEETGDEIFSWIGGGDLRLGILMGLLLGWQHGFLALFAAYFLGTLAAVFLLIFTDKKKDEMIAFGPFLITTTILFLFWGEYLWAEFIRFLGI